MEYFIGGLVGAVVVFFALYLPTRKRVADLEYEVSEVSRIARHLRGEINTMAGEYQSDDVPQFLREQAE